nr:hypothetical protein CparaKRNrm3_p125 [Cryptomonas paramecium]
MKHSRLTQTHILIYCINVIQTTAVFRITSDKVHFGIFFVMSYKKLYSFLKQKFWFEFDILNQKFVNLSKNTLFLTTKELKNCKIYPKKTLICYYHLFDKFLNRINCHKIICLFLVSICRFELVYTEDKLIFLEAYFKIKTKQKKIKTCEFFPAFIELINYKILICYEKKNKLLYQIFTSLIKLTVRIKNTRIKHNQLQIIYKTAIRRLCDNAAFGVSCFRNISLMYKLYDHIKEILNKYRLDYTSKFGVYERKNLCLFNFYDFFLTFLLNKSSNIEKKNWFNMKNISRFKRFKKKISFLEKIQSYNYANYIYSFYHTKRIQSNDVDYLLMEKILKKNYRFSHMNRFKEFFLKDLNLIINKFFLKYQMKKKINTEKQVLRPVKNRSLFILYSFINKILKNKKIISIYDSFLMFINLINHKLKF